MSEERLEIPIDVDLSPMRTALAQLDTSVNAVPDVDLTPMVSEVGRLGHEVTKITTDGAAGLTVIGHDVDLTPAITGLQQVSGELNVLEKASTTTTAALRGMWEERGGIESTTTARQKVRARVDDLKVSAGRAERRLTVMNWAFSLMAKVARLLSPLGGIFRLTAQTLGHAATATDVLSAAFAVVGNLAASLSLRLRIILLPLRALVVIPKLIAGAFGTMFTVILAPFRLLIGAVKLAAKALWAVAGPIIKLTMLAKGIAGSLFGMLSPLRMVVALTSALPVPLRAAAAGFVLLGATGRIGRVALGLLTAGMRTIRITLLAVTSPLQALKLTLVSAARTMTAMTAATLRAARGLLRFGVAKTVAGIKGLSSAVGNAAGMIGGKFLSVVRSGTKALAGLFAIGVGWGVKLAADAEQAQIGFATMLKSGTAAKAVLADLEQFAASTPFQLDSLRDGAKQLLNAQVPTSELTKRLTMLGDIAAGTGKPINDFVRIFAKVKSTGKVSLETLNQLAEHGVPIYAALGTQLGKSRTEMLSMISKGKIGFSDLDGALRSVATGAGVFAGGMQAQSESAAGLWSTLVDNLKFALREFGSLVMSAFNFKGLMKQGIGFFQTLKAGIASARPAFIATAAIVKSAFKAVWEVVSVTFETIGAALGATGGDFMGTFVEMAAVAAFAFKDWPTIAELAFTNIALFLVGLGADFLHLFTVRIPAIMAIFGTVMASTFRTVGDFVGTVFGNMLTNIKNTMRAIWDFIASGGTAPLKLAWQPLTDGFRATVAEIPDIPDRALTDLERTLTADSERLGAALSTGLADEIAANMEMLNDFQSTRIEPPRIESVTADAITAEEAATPDTKGKKRTNFVVDSLERGSEDALNAIFANQNGDKTAEQSLKEQKQQTKALKKLASQPTLTLNIAGVP